MTPIRNTPGVGRVHHPVVPRALTVQAVTDLSPSMRRVTLGGPALRGFASLGPTDHVKVFFPSPDLRSPDGTVPMPTVEDGRWSRDGAYTFRDYTVRTFRPDSAQVVLDMVTGEHGPAGRWASRAAVGQPLGILGPKSSKIPPLDRDWYLMAVDDTGLPALANWLDRLPDAAPVEAFVEVCGPAGHVALPHRARTRITWLHRDGAAPGTTTLLPDAVAAACPGPDDGAGWVFAAAEAGAVRAIRAVVRDRGLTGSAALTGYWRRGDANFDHHSPLA